MFSLVGILTFRICWNLFIILHSFSAYFSQMIQGYLRGKKKKKPTHSALIFIQVITHHLKLIV